MSHADTKRRVTDFLKPAIAAVLATWLALQFSIANALIKAAGIKKKGGGDWSAITSVAEAIQAPMLVTMIAAVPLGILGGGILMAIGHRNAAKILGQVVAGVVIVGIGTSLAE